MNAQQFSTSFSRERHQALSDLRPTVRPHPAIRLANAALFKELRRPVQRASGSRSQMANVASCGLTSSVSTALNKRCDMRFIIVNGRTPCAHPVCVKCEKAIAVGYLREIGTHL